MESWEKFLKEATEAEARSEAPDPAAVAAALQIVLNATPNWEGDYEFKPADVEKIKVALGAPPELEGTEEEWSQIFDDAGLTFEPFYADDTPDTVRAKVLEKLVGKKPKEVAKWKPFAGHGVDDFFDNAGIVTDGNTKKLSAHLDQKYRKQRHNDLVSS